MGISLVIAFTDDDWFEMLLAPSGPDRSRLLGSLCRYSEHVVGDGPRFRAHACKLALEGAISKRVDLPHAPRAIAESGPSPSALTAKSLSLSAGPIPTA